MCASYVEFFKPEHKYWFVQRTPYLMFITRYLSFRQTKLPPVITPSLEPTEFRPNKSTEACSRAERGIHLRCSSNHHQLPSDRMANDPSQRVLFKY